jgi:hypothetical protein
METYVFKVEQIIEVKANSKEEAQEKLPTYPTFWSGAEWECVDETLELLHTEEINV